MFKTLRSTDLAKRQATCWVLEVPEASALCSPEMKKVWLVSHERQGSSLLQGLVSETQADGISWHLLDTQTHPFLSSRWYSQSSPSQAPS